MCIPSQITCNCYFKVFNAFNVFKVSSLQGIWSMDFLIRFLVSCIILHLTGWNFIPHFLAQEPNRSVALWSFIMSTSSLISRQQTQSLAKSLISDSISDEMSFMYRENNKGPRTVPWSPIRFYSIYNSLLSEAKKRIYPFQCFATNSIAKQFSFKKFMRGCIKCLFKIQYECVNLSSIVQDFSPIIYYRSQLGFTTMSFPERMLPIWQEFIFIKMSHDIWTVRVTCKVHKSRKPGDNCTQVTCHSSWKEGRYLQETIPLGFHQCQLIAEKDE